MEEFRKIPSQVDVPMKQGIILLCSKKANKDYRLYRYMVRCMAEINPMRKYTRSNKEWLTVTVPDCRPDQKDFQNERPLECGAVHG